MEHTQGYLDIALSEILYKLHSFCGPLIFIASFPVLLAQPVPPYLGNWLANLISLRLGSDPRSAPAVVSASMHFCCILNNNVILDQVRSLFLPDFSTNGREARWCFDLYFCHVGPRHWGPILKSMQVVSNTFRIYGNKEGQRLSADKNKTGFLLSFTINCVTWRFFCVKTPAFECQVNVLNVKFYYEYLRTWPLYRSTIKRNKVVFGNKVLKFII